MFFEDFNWQEMKNRTIRQNLTYFRLSCYTVTISYMALKLFSILFGNNFPFTTVISGSMEPGFKRGDILLLKTQSFRPGDAAVFQLYKGTTRESKKGFNDV